MCKTKRIAKFQGPINQYLCQLNFRSKFKGLSKLECLGTRRLELEICLKSTKNQRGEGSLAYQLGYCQVSNRNI